jgi:nitroreductase
MTDSSDCGEFTQVRDAIHHRHSERAPFDPGHHLAERDVEAILEAARWAPTAHNMQNFEIVVVDDEATLAAIGRVRGGTSEDFIRENYAQLSFSEEDLIRRGTGLIATMFPPSWRSLDGQEGEARDVEHGFLDASMGSCPLVMIVVYDTRQRAPASEGDFLGIMSLGCVMQNMWLTAETLGVGMQIMSVFSSQQVEQELRRILSIPHYLDIAFACRLGYPSVKPSRYLRVRREIPRFTHHNTYAVRGEG